MILRKIHIFYLSLLLVLTGTALAEPSRSTADRDKRLRQTRIAFESLARGRALTVRWSADGVFPSMIRGLDEPSPGVDASARARGFLEKHRNLFIPAGQLEVIETRSTNDLEVVRVQQVLHGYPVLDGTAAVALDRRGHVTAVHSELKDVALDTLSPRITPVRAAALALAAVRGQSPSARLEAELAGARPDLVIVGEGEGTLAYRVFLPLWLDSAGRIHLVEASTGRYLGWRPGMIIDRDRTDREVRR